MSKYTTIFDNDEVVVDRDDEGNYRVSFFEDYHWKAEYFYTKRTTKNNERPPIDLERDVRETIEKMEKLGLNDSYSYTYIPECCKNCSGHPSNGGSGICNCAAPFYDKHNPWKVTCSDYSTESSNVNCLYKD